jgi:hypothetical protein
VGTKKKKQGRPKQPPKHRGHYCRICGEYKANEKFSGRGHAAHICKACASKSQAEQSEDMTKNKLHSMMFRRLSEAEMTWLKNRRNDSRPEVKELAQQVFEEKFPRQARNEIKQRLHIKNMVFRVRGEVYDGYGDEYNVNTEFVADTSGKIVKKLFDDGNESFVEEKSIEIGVKAIRKLFNVAVHNYDISFWDTDLCHEISYDPDIDLLPEYRRDEEDEISFDDFVNSGLYADETERSDPDSGDEPDDRIPTWSVEINYKNGTEQKTKGYDFIPNPVMELFGDFDSYFEEDTSGGEFDKDADDNGGGDESI